MVTFTEVLHTIAEDVLNDKSGIRYDFNMCITNNVKDSQEDFVKKYGSGKSYHFPIESYEHGQQLAIAIYRVLSGKQADIPANTAASEQAEKALFLLIHLSPLKTV